VKREIYKKCNKVKKRNKYFTRNKLQNNANSLTQSRNEVIDRIIVIAHQSTGIIKSIKIRALSLSTLSPAGDSAKKTL
jgi:3-methyladenine DNA glycosylase AlkC